jgi:hypothetical protein
MATSRRTFLKTGTMGLLCAGIPVALAKFGVAHPASAGDFSETNVKGLLGFTKDAFTPYLNTAFRVRTNSGITNLRLATITDLKSTARVPALMAGRESFSLIFVRRDHNKHFPQDTYLVEHPSMGKFSLFLVPVGKAANKQYEAIITRL